MTEDLVLIIDADELERRRLCQMFEQARFSVIEAAASVEGLFQVLESAPSLILLAEEMPPLKAADLLTVLRYMTDAPVIVIGDGGDPEEVAALGEGADYYIRRPVSRAMLFAHSLALLRRYGSSRRGQRSQRTSEIRDDLRPTARRLVVCLGSHHGRSATPQQLPAAAWGGHATTGSVKLYMWRLQHKLQGSDLGIQSPPSIGYRLVSDGGEAASRAAV